MKQNLQPKQSTELKLSTKTKWIIAGGSIVILLISIFLLYSMLGNNTDANANPSNIYAVSNGSWSSPSTWNISGIPGNGDEVIIDSNITVVVQSPVIFNGTVKVYGTLKFTNGKLTMDSTSSIQIHENGEIISTGPGSSDKITIGSYAWIGNNINLISSPNELTWTGTTGGNPLPVTLAYFKGESENGNIVALEWATYVEKNNDFFTLEKSKDGNRFEKVAMIDGAGNSDQTEVYYFEDITPYAGPSYYRLKQSDFNGEYEYHPIIQVEHVAHDKSVEIVSAGPNPFRDFVVVDINAEQQGKVELILADMNGQLIKQDKISTQKGPNSLKLEVDNNLPQGIYFLQVIHDGKKSAAHKLVKQ